MKKNKKLANFLFFCIIVVLAIIAVIVVYCVCDLFGINLSYESKFLILIIFIIFVLTSIEAATKEANVFDEENDSVNSYTSEKNSNEAIKNIKRKKNCNTMLDEYYLYQKSTNTHDEDLKDKQEETLEIEKELSILSKQLILILLFLVILLMSFVLTQIIY